MYQCLIAGMKKSFIMQKRSPVIMYRFLEDDSRNVWAYPLEKYVQNSVYSTEVNGVERFLFTLGYTIYAEDKEILWYA
jgi:hypothetical protein